MSDVERLLTEYKHAHRESGDADPRPYLERASGIDRELLAGLIDAYLEAAPRRDFDPLALRSSPAAAVAEGVQRSLEGQSGMWPGPPRQDAGAVFARTTMGRVSPPGPGQAPAQDTPEAATGAAPEDWDEVDRLFRGRPPSA